MSILDKFAHALLQILGVCAGFVLDVLSFVEGGLRSLMHGAGVGPDVQTCILIFIVSTFLVGVSRLLKGVWRFSLGLTLILILAHTLGHLAHGGMG